MEEDSVAEPDALVRILVGGSVTVLSIRGEGYPTPLPRHAPAPLRNVCSSSRRFATLAQDPGAMSYITNQSLSPSHGIFGCSVVNATWMPVHFAGRNEGQDTRAEWGALRK